MFKGKAKVLAIFTFSLIALLGISYSIFTLSTSKYTSSELLVGNLLYGITVHDTDGNLIEGTSITQEAGTKEYFITVYSVNKVGSRYTLAHNSESAEISVSNRSNYAQKGFINEYDTYDYSKTIKIKVVTTSTETINFAAFGGYSYNTGASINLGNGYYTIIFR